MVPFERAENGDLICGENSKFNGYARQVQRCKVAAWRRHTCIFSEEAATEGSGGSLGQRSSESLEVPHNTALLCCGPLLQLFSHTILLYSLSSLASANPHSKSLYTIFSLTNTLNLCTSPPHNFTPVFPVFLAPLQPLFFLLPFTFRFRFFVIANRLAPAQSKALFNSTSSTLTNLLEQVVSR
jgi:hypothetical protein